MTQVKGLPELPPTYNPSETEPVVSATWDQQNVFHADASESLNALIEIEKEIYLAINVFLKLLFPIDISSNKFSFFHMYATKMVIKNRK